MLKSIIDSRLIIFIVFLMVTNRAFIPLLAKANVANHNTFHVEEGKE